MGREGAEPEGEAFALTAEGGQAQGQDGADGVVQLVGRTDEFGLQERDALLGPADVAQRAGALDQCPAASPSGNLATSASITARNSAARSSP